jgi:dTDP-4-dehydrorhamnose reductase
MKVLVFGASGMLGHKLIQVLNGDHEVFGTIRGEFGESERRVPMFAKDRIIAGVAVDDPATVRRAIEQVRPDVVLNAIGVIKQISDAKNVITTLTVNSIFPHRLSELAGEFGFRLITVSTDCVFDGARGNYTEDDIPNATDLYGKSKNLGEVVADNCLTIRTSIIGHEISSAHSLVDWFLSNRGGKVKGYVNAIYSGFPTVVFAAIIDNLIRNHQNLSGLYHVSSDPIDKYQLLKLISEEYNADIEVEPFEDFRIDRSLNSDRFRNEVGFSPEKWPAMIKAMADDARVYETWKL